MAHMQKQITEKMRGWCVETFDAGTCYVPGDVVAVPADFKVGDAFEQDSLTWGELVARLADYVEGRSIESIEVCDGYFARMSAPGYLDCTEWGCHPTIKDARAALRDRGGL